jgi:hypothetical protein
MRLFEYVVFVSCYDELSTLVVDAPSSEEAVAMAKLAMEKLAREQSSDYRWSKEEIERYVAGFRNYDYRASTTAKILANSSKVPTEQERMLEVLKHWREPRLPTGCPY